MSRRLQVLMSEREIRELKRAAKREGQTMSEWVRQRLKEALAGAPAGRKGTKLEVIRAATRHAFPAPDIDQMNEEIARGYATGWAP